MKTNDERLEELQARKPCVVVDWDGTCVPNAWPERPYEWLPGAEAALHALLAAGYEVKIHSTRLHEFDVNYTDPNPGRDEEIDYIKTMLHSACLDGVVIAFESKPPAEFYVDDKAVRFTGDWPSVLFEMGVDGGADQYHRFSPAADDEFMPRLMNSVRRFETGATRDTDTGKLDYEGFLSPLVVRRFGEFMHGHRTQSDGSLRDSDNWQKGIPLDAYMKSLFRHVMEVWLIHRGHQAVDEEGGEVSLEDALCAVIFNAQGYLHEVLKEAAV